jgi:DNA-directed RNA polymerase sigma subunit (sigma70/sigma32)
VPESERERVRAALAMRRAGAHTIEIAHVLGLSRERVREILKLL